MPGDQPEFRDRAGFARELTAVRERAGLTIREVAAKIGVPAATLGGYFAGSHLPPLRSPSVLGEILKICGIGDPQTHEHWHTALRELRRLPGRRPADAAAPYRGLASFGPADAEWYFGREDLTAALVAEFHASRSGPLMVIGPSGSGKSSLLCAGLLPAVRDDVDITIVTPGANAVAALQHGGGVVVDQFEEVFTHATESERRVLLKALAEASGQVIIGMRSDFYDHALREPVLAASLQDRQVIVGPMSDEQLRRAIVEPARRASVDVEDGLVEVLLRDAYAARSAGALPLLSHALLSTWERGRRHSLRLDDYRATGGIQGAVAATAEEIYLRLDAAGRDSARRTLLRLVRLDGDLMTRRRITRSELPDGDNGRTVIDRLIAGRLLTADGLHVEITHEALLTAWPRLCDWIDADRAGLRVHRQLTVAAKDWEESAHDRDTLLRGARLASAREWAAEHDGDLNERERRYLSVSVEHDEAELRATRARSRRLAQLLAAVSVLLVAAVGLASYAYVQRNTANTQRDLAISRDVAITADHLRATDPPLAALLSLAAFRIAGTTQARSSLLASYAGPAPTRIVGPPGVVQSAAVSPDGAIAATGAPDHTVHLWDLATHRRLGAPAAGHEGTIFALAFSPDGRLLATGSGDRTVRLWRPGPGGAEPAGQFTVATNTVYSVAFSRDGTVLAAGSADGTVTLWRPDGPQPLAMVRVSDQAVHTVAFSPDGHTLAAGGDDRMIHLLDVAQSSTPTMRPPAPTGHTGIVYSVAFSPDGRTLGSGSGDMTVRLWDVTDLDRPKARGSPLIGPTGWVNAVAFTPDGRLVVGGSSDQKAWLWDAATGTQAGALPHPAQVTDVRTIGRQGTVITTAAADGVLRRWRLPGPVIPAQRAVFNAIPASTRNTVVVAGGEGGFGLWDTTDPRNPAAASPPMTVPGGDGAATISPDARSVAAGSTDGTVRLWDVSHPATPVPLPVPLTDHHDKTEAVMFSPDSRVLAIAGDDHMASLWDVSSPSHPARIGPPMGAENFVYSPVFSLDGTLFAYGTADGRAYLWDVHDPQKPAALGPPLPKAASPVFAVAFRPDGHTLATADTAIRLWDITDPRHPTAEALPLTGPDHTVWSLAFAPDGNTLAVGTGDGTIWLWSTADPRHPQLSATLPAHTGQVFTVAFDPTNGTLLSGAADHTTRLWNLNPESVAAFICATAGTPISAEEWKRYVPGKPYRAVC